MVPFLAALLVVTGSQNVTTNPRVARHEIQRRYDEWSKAYMAMEVDTLLGILTSDYILVNVEKKTTTLDEYSAYLRLRKKSGYKDPVKTSTTIKGLKLMGAEADVDAVETMSSDATDPETHKPAKCLHRHEYLDIWQFGDGKWRLSKTTTVKESTTYRLKRAES